MHRTQKAVLVAITTALTWTSVSSAAKGGSTPAAASPSASSASAASAAASTPSSTAALETQILAYGGIDATALKIAGNVCAALKSKSGASIVIYDQATFANLQAFAAFQQNALSVENAYYTLQGLPIPIPFASATVTESTSLSLSFSPVSDLATLLSTIAVSSNTETYGSVTIPDSALAIAVAHHLKQSPDCIAGKLTTVVYPPLFGQGSAGSQAAQNIQGIILRLNQARKSAHDATSAALKNVAANTYPAAALADIDVLYDNVMGTLINTNSTTGIVGSVSIIQGQQLASLLSKDNTFVLLATVLSAGGTVHDHKTFWTNLTNGDIFTYSGGSIVGTALWQPSAGTAPIYTDLINYRTDLSRAPVDVPSQGLAIGPSS